MSRFPFPKTQADNNISPASPTEHHVIKRILVGLLAATCMVGASAANIAPTVSMTAPAASAAFVAPATMALSANAADSDGTISRVAFYTGTTLIGTVKSAPYNLNWPSVAAGTYSVTSRATDNLGAVTTSAALSVTVKTNTLPSVTISAPATGSSYVAPATINMTAVTFDSDGTVTKVDYYRGTTLIGTSTTAPYAVSWNSAAAGTYSLTAKATDDKGGVTTSPVVSVVVKVNALPTVALTSPVSNQNFAAPGIVSLSANAADSDGTISKVDYFRGTTLVGTATTAPYSATWSSAAVGSYSMTAKAYDNKGGVTTSAAVAITVKANVAPSVSVTAPVASAGFVGPATVALSASATDSDGTVAKVDFYNGAALLGTATGAPFTFSWTSVAAGSYSVTAKATDDKGAVSTSAAVAVTVKANIAPTVSITAPANNDAFYGPGSLTLTASAADADGTVASVAFYNGAALIGTASTAPYTVTWPNVAVANYSVTAKATDDKGLITTSAPVAVDMQAAPVPTVSITAPLDNARYIAPAVLTFTAGASISAGTISKVEFISGGNVIGVATAPPYSMTLNNVAAGAYGVTAKATGSFGGTGTSSPVNVVVTDNAAPVVSLLTNPATAAAPAVITLTATATDSDGTVAKVEFFNGETLLATVTQAPFTYTWNDVAAGTYALTARATDNLNLAATSSVQTLTITAPSAPGGSQVFYIFSDQINTAREITNAAGVKVWQADPEPFGANLPNENPAGQGKFTYNQRFPGQYFDKETGLHYNYYRDYDPQTGRYVQSDPIGLDGGINTYGYVHASPLSRTDPFGLAPKVVVCVNGVCPPIPPPGLVDPMDQPLEPSPKPSFPSNDLFTTLTNPLFISAFVANTLAAACGNEECKPSVGTRCYTGPDTTHGHGGLGNHYHIYQMFRFDGKCQWKYLGGKVGKGVLETPTDGMAACSSYPGFTGR